MDWRQEGRQRVKEKSAGSTIKITEGNNCIRILPDRKDLLPDGKPKPGGFVNRPYREFRVHRNVGPDERMVACGLNIDQHGSCWLCQKQIPALEAQGKIKMAQKIRAAEQFLVNGSQFDLDSQRFQPPKPWWVSTGNGQPGRQGESLAVRVYSRMVNGRKDLIDPARGYNLNITRTGTGIKTRYTEIEADENPTKVPLSILAAIKDLDTVVPKYSEEDQRNTYFGRTPTNVDGESEEGAEAGSGEDYETGASSAEHSEDYGVEDIPPESYADGEAGTEAYPAEEPAAEGAEGYGDDAYAEEPPIEESPTFAEDYAEEPEPTPAPAPPPRRAAPPRTAAPPAKPAPKPTPRASAPPPKPPAKKAPPTRHR